MFRRFLILCICPARYDSLLKLALASAFLAVTYEIAEYYAVYAAPEYQYYLWVILMAFSGLTMATLLSAWKNWNEFYVRPALRRVRAELVRNDVAIRR